MIQRRKVIIGAMGVAAAAATAGCSSSGKDGGGATSWVGAATDTEQVAVVTPVRLSVTPANGDADVSPVKPIVVSAADGKLQSVTVTAGKATIDGAMQDDGTWR